MPFRSRHQYRSRTFRERFQGYAVVRSGIIIKILGGVQHNVFLFQQQFHDRKVAEEHGQPKRRLGRPVNLKDNWPVDVVVLDGLSHPPNPPPLTYVVVPDHCLDELIPSLSLALQGFNVLDCLLLPRAGVTGVVSYCPRPVAGWVVGALDPGKLHQLPRRNVGGYPRAHLSGDWTGVFLLQRVAEAFSTEHMPAVAAHGIAHNLHTNRATVAI
mmetsp:Transcript_1592/g.2819  ORF Transcript_1592/g.2819 Transcript_1592/m.2819 type:complete len:213 (+) Transcript_1592:482-1120(+)